jgi:hypothetical protein
VIYFWYMNLSMPPFHFAKLAGLFERIHWCYPNLGSPKMAHSFLILYFVMFSVIVM